MVYEADPALKRAIKFFKEQTVHEAGTPLYHDESTDRLFANIFIASGVPSKNQFRFTGSYMESWIHDFEGQPIVLFKKGDHFAHPTIAEASKEINDQFQESKKVGIVHKVFEPDKNYTYRGVGEIIVSKVKNFLKALKTEIVPMFTSPSVSYYGDDYDIRKATPRHVALTDDPAFPPEISRIKALCEGPESSCLAKLAEAKTSEAGESKFVCFGDAIEDLVLNASVDNTSLKIIDFKSNLSDMENKDSESGSKQKTELDNKEDTEKKTPAEITDAIIQAKAKEAMDKMLEEYKAKFVSNEKPDPKATMDKAFGNDNTKKDEGVKADSVDNERISNLEKELAEQRLINRKNEIAKRIPIAMVTDVKSGGVNEKLLNEVVDYWVAVKDKTPEEIGQFLEKQTLQVEAVSSAKQPKKAEGSNEKLGLSDNELAEQMSTRFDAPDADSNREKHAEAAVKEAAWQYELAGMLVSNVSKENVGKGAPRRILQ